MTQTPKSQWYGDEHGSNKQRSQDKFKNKNKLKKHTVQNHTNIKTTFQKINHELHKHKHLLCDWWFQSMPSWYHQTKSMKNIESQCRILWTWIWVFYKKHHQNHENAFKGLHAKTTENLYIKKSQNSIYYLYELFIPSNC